MVYWGCGTTRNRCMWGMFVCAALAGSLLLIAGGAKLDICSKLPVYVHITGTCKLGPTAMMIIGAFVLLGTIPSLLFFSGCAQGPPQAKYSEGVPASGITVVRRTASGPQVFQYDADGKLMAAPDCQRHTSKASSPQPHVMKELKPVKTAPALPGEPKQDSAGDSPRHAARPRLYGSESGDAATAEVYISAVVPMGPLAAARAQQQQLYYQQQLQQQQRQQQEQDHMEQQQQQQLEERQHQGQQEQHHKQQE